MKTNFNKKELEELKSVYSQEEISDLLKSIPTDDGIPEWDPSDPFYPEDPEELIPDNDIVPDDGFVPPMDPVTRWHVKGNFVSGGLIMGGIRIKIKVKAHQGEIGPLYPAKSIITFEGVFAGLGWSLDASRIWGVLLVHPNEVKSWGKGISFRVGSVGLGNSSLSIWDTVYVKPGRRGSGRKRRRLATFYGVTVGVGRGVFGAKGEWEMTPA